MLLLLSSDHFALPLLDICTASGLAGWIAAALLCILFILALRLVSVAVLWLLCLLLAVLFCLLLAMLFSVLFTFLPFSRLSAALRAHRRFDVLHAVLAPVLLYFVLLATGSLDVVLYFSFTTGPLAVAFVSDPLQRHFVVLYSFLDASPALPTPLLSTAPFVIVGPR